jgi:C4-dicarboxylate-specific signal transduction histidine kinase
MPRLPDGFESAGPFPWITQKILAGEMISCSRLEDLPPEAGKDVESARVLGGRSGVTIPLKFGGTVVGGVSFSSTTSGKTWSAEVLQRLRLIAEIFGNALERKRSASAMRRVNEELHKVSNVVMMGELTASLAHELNQPLGAIRSNAQAAMRLLSAEKPDFAEIRGALADIVRDNARAVDTVRHVRAMFKRREAERSHLDIREVLREVERILRYDAKSKGVSFTLHLGPSIPLVAADRAQISQAIICLVLNAFDAVSEVARARDVAVSAWPSPSEAELHVAVRDTGNGINPEVMPRLFDAFFTTKQNGMGMGLAIAKSIIENHDGQLSARNTEGGAIFEFVLPAAAVDDTN